MCLCSLVNPCWGFWWRQDLCDEMGPDNCDGPEDMCLIGCVWCTMLVPALGWLTGPCLIAGIYPDPQEAVIPERSCCHALLSVSAAEPGGLPCGLGVPCCLFPCTARQMLRERVHRNETGGDSISLNSLDTSLVPAQDVERLLEQEQHCAELYLQDRVSTWDNKVSVELSLFQGPESATFQDQPIFGPRGAVRVGLWQTVAEVVYGNQSEWVVSGQIHDWHQGPWLQGLLGSNQISARMQIGEEWGWVSGYEGTAVTTMGELWIAAQENICLLYTSPSPRDS
eukprot:TRINITY_DN8712_c0_g1_i3.p1 TRINITY_DN8712_c0_g1~~TRINITY_DN8712_c0_g1_i3.p1  ORF type:complete len:282 (+),score=28.39 TRINITY_DN8712_c0_g1_i3:297-1142(+)